MSEWRAKLPMVLTGDQKFYHPAMCNHCKGHGHPARMDKTGLIIYEECEPCGGTGYVPIPLTEVTAKLRAEGWKPK